ncbi:MAG: S4 domain-containing protein [Clostridia bacterium]|jgi:tyrosyl-tRNA synthetase
MNKNKTIVDICVESGFIRSKSEARRLIKQGGLYVNEERLDKDRPVGLKDFSLSRVVSRKVKDVQ